MKKPVITRAGKKPESTVNAEKKSGFFSRRRAAKKLEIQKRRKADAATRKAILRKQKARKKKLKADLKLSAKKQESSRSANTKPAITKIHSSKVKQPDKKIAKRLKKTSKKIKKSRVGKKTKISKRKNNPKLATAIITISLVTVLSVLGVSFVKHRNTSGGFISSESTKTNLLGDKSTVSSEDKRPDFVQIDPTTDAGDLRSHYDPDKGFYSFQEELNGKLITVNQQPLPEDFKLTADMLLSQTEYDSVGSFETNKGTVYITTAESGPQQAIEFVFENLLIFITTNEQVTQQEWVSYINSL